VPNSRQARLVEAKRRIDEELAVEHAANEWYEHYPATAVDRLGRKPSTDNRKSKPYSPPLVPEARSMSPIGLAQDVHPWAGFL